MDERFLYELEITRLRRVGESRNMREYTGIGEK